MKITIISSNTEMEEILRIKEEIVAAGHEPEVVDFTRFHFSFVNGEIDFHPEIPESDLYIVRGMFSAMRSVEPLAAYLKSKGAIVFDNNLFEHKYSINKVFDITKLIFSNIPTPNFYHSRNYEGLFEYAEKMDYPAIVKTAGTGKGVSIYKLNSKEEMVKMLTEWQEYGYKARKIVVQNFVDYRYDLRVLVMGEEMYCMRRIPPKGDFRANFSLGGSVELFELTPEIRNLARKAVDAIGLKVAGVDVLIDNEGKMYILEVNHTPGFVGMEKATGENIGKIYLDYAIKNTHKIK